MPRINDVYAGDYLKADALDLGGGRYKTVQVTIQTAKVGTVGEGNDAKDQIVISYAEIDQSLGLNKTNAENIARITGSFDTDGWIGKRIELFAGGGDFRSRRPDPFVRREFRCDDRADLSDPDKSPVDHRNHRGRRHRGPRNGASLVRGAT